MGNIFDSKKRPTETRTQKQADDVWKAVPDNPKYEVNGKGQMRTKNYVPTPVPAGKTWK